jgi:1,6-anhydro-N-acetylmuramate kinase
MRVFIDANPGLRSRFTNYIDFPDYSTAELVEIFEVMAAQARVNLGPGVRERLSTLFADAATGTNFGNARFARSVFEDAYANMASRAMADGKIERSEIQDMVLEDLPAEERHQFAEHRPIGFRAPPGSGPAKPEQSGSASSGAQPAEPKQADASGAPATPPVEPAKPSI